ncbi:TonB-dependent receptor [Rhodanobacter sp. PCA2]|uniref:TonB-dependent receptor plug domain-containing protein n=1 Tax=Rhodanobacter sp. PCA2 TaxID=2006117 RepID=UPI0015E7171A|nr:TonB-dependent receptor [Rhodanobacter sp. PCA2]
MRHAIAMRRNALVSALSVALLSPLAAYGQAASSTASDQAAAPQTGTPAGQSSSTASQQKAVQLKEVVVTGSMIPRVEVEGPAPVVTITGAQIKAQGFTTMWEFLDSLPQMGQTQDPASWGSTSVNARSVNLRNLGPGFSLLMIDGHRVVDYPQPMNAQSNFQNYNNIPTGMIDHVEILASGASSIYGSDAVAGVVNVILKKNYQGDELQITGGGATRGGRSYGDINFFGGKSGENWHLLYNLEKSNRTALWGKNRPYQDSVSDAGYGAWGPAARMFGYQYDTAGGIALSATNGLTGQYITPPAGTCDKFTNSQLSHSYSVSTSGTQITGVTDNGYYCSQPHLFQNWVLTPGSRSNNGYVAGEYDFSNGLQLYGSAALYKTVGISNTQMWGVGTGAFYDQNTGQVISQAVRQFTAQETGTSMNTHDRETNWNITAGLRGTMFGGNFNWDLSLNTQKYIVREDYTAFNQTATNNFFLGQQQGTTTVAGYNDGNGNPIVLPVYAMNWQQWWNPITPQQYSQFAVNGENSASSWLDQAQFRINGDLFRIPWTDQSVGWAAVLEAAHNGFLLSPDPRGSDSSTFVNPFYANNTGGGTRQRFSLGTEFRVPVLDSLTWTISGRLDKYHDSSSADIARTWGTGIEWRPIDSLLLRGSYGTNFKAPDMQAIDQTGSTVPVGIYEDYLSCINDIKAGNTNSTWCNGSIQRPQSQYYTQYTAGNRLLKSQTGHSWTYGFVWQIPGVQGLSVSADYWHMGVDNTIQYLGQDTVLKDEAGCLTGVLPVGSSGLAPYIRYPQGSEYCRMVEAMVQRNAAGNITSVHSGPINVASTYVSGVDASLDYKLHTENYGDFRANVIYTNNLAYKNRTVASDPLINTRYDRVASKVSWIGDWTKGDWNVSLSGQRVGTLRANNYGGCEVLPNGTFPGIGDPDCTVYKGRIPPWIVWNTAVGWQINRDTKLTLAVSNIFNKVAGIAYYSGGFEFVPTGQTAGEYNGREWFLTFDYKLN